MRDRTVTTTRVREALGFTLLALGVFLGLCLGFELTARRALARHPASAEVVRWNGRLAEAALALEFADLDTATAWLLLVGDSTLALMAPRDLERQLGGSVRVANLAVPGLIAGNLERYLRIFLEPLRPGRLPGAVLVSFAPHSLVVHPVHHQKLESGRRDYDRMLHRQALPLLSRLRFVRYGLTLQDLFEMDRRTERAHRAAMLAEAQTNAQPSHEGQRVSAELLADLLRKEWPAGSWTVDRRSMDGLAAGVAYLVGLGPHVYVSLSPICYQPLLPESFGHAARALTPELRGVANRHAPGVTFVAPPVLGCAAFRDWSHVNPPGLDIWTAAVAAAMRGAR